MNQTHEASPAGVTEGAQLEDSADAVSGNGAEAAVRKRPTTTRMFKSDFIEYFSRVHPITPFVVWVPVLAFIMQRNVRRADTQWFSIVGLFLAGFALWTLTEYLLHRYVFHWQHDSAFGRRFHFLIHGVHHDFPQDKDRLVMPVGASAPMAVVFYGFFWLLLGARIGDPMFCGFGLGYLFYDGSHFALHHFNFKAQWFHKLKRHHMLHHHTHVPGRFGVSMPFWDHVFGTFPEQTRRRS
jgi:dihydroceramide fatty acyl 2-hydroxylase